MTLIHKESTWTVRLGGSELEYLANALGIFTAIAKAERLSPVHVNELRYAMENYEGRQGEFLAKLAVDLRAEVDREYPPKEFGENEEDELIP